MSLKHIDGFDQYSGQVGASLLSSLSAAGYTVTSGLGMNDGRKAGGLALELQVAAGAAGASWSSRVNDLRQDLHDIAANSAGRFVAVGNAGSAVYSDDSLSWLPLVLGVGENMKAIEVNASTWITVGDNGTILRSGDGRNYVPRTLPSATASNLKDVRFGGGVWVIVGANGAVGVIFISTDDGLSWVQVATSPTLAALSCVSFGGTWCAGGTGGAVLTSVDATTWTAGTFAGVINITDMEFGSGGHLLATGGTSVYKSTDGGVSWGVIAANIGPGSNLAIVEADGRWVVCSGGGQMLISDDEVTWTAPAFAGAASTPLYGLCVFRGARVGYAVVGALNKGQAPAAQRALIYLSLAPPTQVSRTFNSTASKIVIGFSHRATARGRILSIKDVLDMDWAAGISIDGVDGVAIPARNVWYYYELVIDKTALTVSLYINNVLDLTAPVPPAVATQTAFIITWISENGAVTRLDDMYLLDNLAPAGETLVDRLGPIQIPLRLPTSDATPNDWSPASGTTHWTQVGILPPSTESFIRSATSGAQDLFLSNAALPADAGTSTAPILAVGLLALAMKGDIDNRQMGLVIGHTGQQKEVVDTSLSTTPEYSVAIFEKAPDNTAWTVANIQATPFGVAVRP